MRRSLSAFRKPINDRNNPALLAQLGLDLLGQLICSQTRRLAVSTELLRQRSRHHITAVVACLRRPTPRFRWRQCLNAATTVV